MRKHWIVALILILAFAEAIRLHSQNYSSGSLVATSSAVAPGALLALACSSTTTSVPGARAGMSVHLTPSADPGVGVMWMGWVSSNDTVSIRECVLVNVTPTSVTYNIRVAQ